MNLTSIRENYGKLLTAFNDAGIKLSESQKADLDTFMVALETKIENTKQSAIKATKKIVESRLGDEYRKVFESILAHMEENSELEAKIQSKMAVLKESQKISNKVDEYLTAHLDKVLPEEEIVNYDRLNKLEKLVESMKETLIVSDDAIEEKSKELDQKYIAESKKLQKKISDLEMKLNESMSKEMALKKEISVSKAKDFIARKTKDLPLFEAKQVQKRMAGATLDEAKANYSKILESVREELEETAKLEEKDLEEEINNIIESSEEKTSDKGEKAESPKSSEEGEDAETDTEGEKKSADEDDGIELDESEKIDANLMKAWIDRSTGITPFDNTARW